MNKFVYCASGSDGALRRHKVILVRAECPYVQFRAAHVTSTEFVVGGYKLAREGGSSQVSEVRCVCSMDRPM